MSGEAAGEIWNWSSLGAKGFNDADEAMATTQGVLTDYNHSAHLAYRSK